MKYSKKLAALRGLIGTVLGALASPLYDWAMGDMSPEVLKRALVIGLLSGLAAGFGVDIHAYAKSKQNAEEDQS